MATEKRNGAGSRLSGLLERSTRPDDVEEQEPAGEPPRARRPSRAGRGVARKTKPEGRPAKVKGRTIYLHDDLYERVIVQAHRGGRTISEYVSAILERQVPDHRVVRAAEGDGPA